MSIRNFIKNKINSERKLYIIYQEDEGCGIYHLIIE